MQRAARGSHGPADPSRPRSLGPAGAWGQPAVGTTAAFTPSAPASSLSTYSPFPTKEEKRKLIKLSLGSVPVLPKTASVAAENLQ